MEERRNELETRTMLLSRTPFAPISPSQRTSPNGFSVRHSPVNAFDQYVTPTSFTCKTDAGSSRMS